MAEPSAHADSVSLTEARVPWYLPRNRRYRRHLKFTREGKVFVFVTVGLGFGAVNTGTNLMYLVFGFMLSLIVLSGILSEHALRKLRVTRRLPAQAFVGEPMLIEIAVENRKERLVSYSIEVEDHARELVNDRRCYFLKVAPGSEQVASYRRIPMRRGEAVFVAFRVATRFPFALFEKWRELAVEDSLLVFPARLKTELPLMTMHDHGDHAGTARGRGTETRELREFRAHDELRAVHWKRSAAVGRLVVREFEREAGHLLSIRLDNLCADPGDTAWQGSFEEQISRCAYLAEYALGRGYAVEICARGERSPNVPSHAPADPIFRFLASLQPTQKGLEFAAPTTGGRVLEARDLAGSGGGRDAA
ncbi:MAG: DUF58 domain-containing protein [Myxococcales bacterium]